MKTFVLDCSVTMAWVLTTQSDDYCREVLKSFEEWQAIVPGIWLYEVANILRLNEDRKKISRQESSDFYKRLRSLPITVVEKPELQSSELLLWMSKSHRMTPYDTAYLYLAMDRGYPLATRDQAMLREAKFAGVALFHP